MNKQYKYAALAATLFPVVYEHAQSISMRPALPVPLVAGFPPIKYTPGWSRHGQGKYFYPDQKNPLKSRCGQGGQGGQGEFQHIAHVCARARVCNILSFFLISVFNYITKCLDHLDHALFFKHLRLDHFFDHPDHLDHADYKD